jgi:hypothetical protein
MFANCRGRSFTHFKAGFSDAGFIFDLPFRAKG